LKERTHGRSESLLPSLSHLVETLKGQSFYLRGEGGFYAVAADGASEVPLIAPDFFPVGGYPAYLFGIMVFGRHPKNRHYPIRRA
jgi:hypothetical protein